MRILIASGGSPHSEAAVRLGAYICHTQRGTDRPTVLAVVHRAADRPRAAKILEEAQAILAPSVSQANLKVGLGNPAEAIIAEAETGQYDLVIVGERPKHRLVTRWLGSISSRVVEHAPCPVLIVKGQAAPIRRILLCDSGAMQPSVLSRFTTQFFDLLRSNVEITVLHVMSQMATTPAASSPQLQAEADELIRQHTPEGELLAQDVETLNHLDVHASPKVRHGLVVEEIVAEAHSGEYDLVVIGDYQGEGWNRLLLDNLAHQITAKVDRPILLVR